MKIKVAAGKTLLALMILILIMSCEFAAGIDNDHELTPLAETQVSTVEQKAEVVEPRKEQIVHVYSARHYAVDHLLFEEFTRQTGIQVKEVKGTAEELVERIKREGEASPADLFIAVDGSVLDYAKRQGVLQPFASSLIEQNVPAEWRDEDHYWAGIATRARVIVYAKDRVSPGELSTYEALTGEQWKGRLLVRSSSNLYNQSMMASFIELYGEEYAEEWAKGIVHNMARVPEGGDRSQAKAVAAGIGDAAIMNTYYIGQLSNSNDQEEVRIAGELGVYFPNQNTTGTHVNISGIGVVKHSKHKEHAIKLIEFLTSVEGQTMLSHGSFEFPTNPEADTPELLKTWGDFKSQQIQVARLNDHLLRAVEIFDKAGWK